MRLKRIAKIVVLLLLGLNCMYQYVRSEENISYIMDAQISTKYVNLLSEGSVHLKDSVYLQTRWLTLKLLYAQVNKVATIDDTTQ
jgi:hypothetical protein